MKKLARATLLATLMLVNGALAANVFAASDASFDKCVYGIPPWGGLECAEYCSNYWGSCGGSCIQDC